MVQFEITWLRVLANTIDSFLQLPSYDHINADPAEKYYRKAEEMLKLLKPILDAIVDCEIGSSEVLNKDFEELAQYVNELREHFESWKPLSSKVYHVLQIELLMPKIQDSCTDILQQLKSCKELSPDELSSSALEKIKHVGHERVSTVIEEALRDQNDNIGGSQEILERIKENLGLGSNEEILIEAVALDKLKENAEQAENNSEAKFLDQLISMINRMHDHLIEIKQSQRCSPGKTYERAFIKRWIDRGLTVCPKTRQSLARANLTPNFTVKAMIANWCEVNGVKPPDPGELVSLDRDAPSHPPISRSRSDPPILPDSLRSSSFDGNLISNGLRKERALPSHPRSTSEGSIYGILHNGHGSDHAGSLNEFQENSECEGKRMDVVAQQISSPSRDLFLSSMTGENERSLNHDKSDRPSSSSHPDADEGINAEASTSSATLQIGPSESSQRSAVTWSRNQKLWRKSSEKRLIPGVVPSATSQTRSDYSEIEAQVRRLVQDLRNPSADTQREATSELRLLARNSMDNRIAIASSGAISLLVDLLSSTDLETQEYAVTALLNLSINDNNKILIANADAIEPLIYVLESGSPVAKENAAASLFSLSVIEENKKKIGQSRAIGPLVDLLGNGTINGKKDAATALFNLSIHHENKTRIVQAGAVKHLVELMDPSVGMVDKVVAVLANLSTIAEGRTAIGQEGAIRVLVEVVELGSPRGKENAAAALCQLCMNSNRLCKIALQEGAVPPLVALSQLGTPRAREKAHSLLSYFRRNQQAAR